MTTLYNFMLNIGQMWSCKAGFTASAVHKMYVYGRFINAEGGKFHENATYISFYLGRTGCVQKMGSK